MKGRGCFAPDQEKASPGCPRSDIGAFQLLRITDRFKVGNGASHRFEKPIRTELAWLALNSCLSTQVARLNGIGGVRFGDELRAVARVATLEGASAVGCHLLDGRNWQLLGRQATAIRPRTSLQDSALCSQVVWPTNN